MNSPKNRLVFIVGATGSGTTMLTRILSTPPRCVGLGGNHISIPPEDVAASSLAEQFNEASARLWNRQADAPTAHAAGQEMVHLVDRLRDLPGYRDTTHVIYKRSFPFFPGDRFRPDLSDLFDLFEDVRLVVLYRDPCASTASSLRREFLPNLRNCAIVTEEQLTYIAAQLGTLDSASYLLLGYEALCNQPEATARQVADFIGVDSDQLAAAARAENVKPDRNDRWMKEMAGADVEFLNRFFDERRRRQWAILEQTNSTATTAGKPSWIRRALRPSIAALVSSVARPGLVASDLKRSVVRWPGGMANLVGWLTPAAAPKKAG